MLVSVLAQKKPKTPAVGKSKPDVDRTLQHNLKLILSELDRCVLIICRACRHLLRGRRSLLSLTPRLHTLALPPPFAARTTMTSSPSRSPSPLLATTQ